MTHVHIWSNTFPMTWKLMETVRNRLSLRELISKILLTEHLDVVVETNNIRYINSLKRKYLPHLFACEIIYRNPIIYFYNTFSIFRSTLLLKKSLQKKNTDWSYIVLANPRSTRFPRPVERNAPFRSSRSHIESKSHFIAVTIDYVRDTCTSRGQGRRKRQRKRRKGDIQRVVINAPRERVRRPPRSQLVRVVPARGIARGEETEHDGDRVVVTRRLSHSWGEIYTHAGVIAKSAAPRAQLREKRSQLACACKPARACILHLRGADSLFRRGQKKKDPRGKREEGRL